MRLVVRIFWFAMVLCAFEAQGATAFADPPPTAAHEAKTIALTKVVTEIPVGKITGTLGKGFFCSVAVTATSNGARSDYNIATVQSAFRQELKAAGLKADDTAENLFEPQNTATASEFSLGGVIADRTLTLCIPNPTGATASTAKGEESLTIDWQVYSRVQNQVVGRFRTTASFSIKEPTPGGGVLINNGVFSASIRQLAAMPDFRAILLAKDADAVTQARETPIVLVGARAIAARPVDDEARSVALVFVGSTEGSAFLISKDGYMLTDAHVVGDAKSVRVRWSDGTDGEADVVRVSHRLDAAVLKTEPHGRPPLPTNRMPPAVGDTVFAIGSPLGEKFQGTVTRGVVSAERTENGHHYIQSDVTVQMGSSGGPLIDSQGRVIGLADKLNGLVLPVSAGLNYFTPVADVLDALNLQPQ